MKNSTPGKIFRYLAFENGKYRRYISQTFTKDMKPQSLEKEIKKPEIPDVHGSYGELLFHPKWREKRQIILHRDNGKCVNCFSMNNLQVHHRQYHFNIVENKFRPPWDYPNHLLITLCEKCHRKGHDQFRVPIINR